MDNQYVVTISHQLGCGGAYIGKQLSKALSIPFMDRQILKQISDYLNLPEADIENLEERTTSFWEAFSRAELLSGPVTEIGAEYLPSDRELYNLESEFIKQIAKKGSAIILGRGGRYILRDYPRHFSVFVHADLKDRVQSVSKLYHVSENASRKIIEQNDHERNAYMKSYTKLEWLDARTYDVCINTSSIGINNVAKIIKESLKFKFEL
jgi:cytidylate kinase